MKIFIILVVLATVVSGYPKMNEASSDFFWNNTAFEGIAELLHMECTDHRDALSCMKYKVLHFLDQVLSQDAFQEPGNVEPIKNDEGIRLGRSEKDDTDILDHLTDYIKSHDVTATIPGSYFQGTTLTMSPRNLDNNEVTVSFKFSQDDREGKALRGEEGRKTKLKKIIVPVLVFVLLKAMTLVPLAIGVLGIKAWNALQLSFFSFVVSLALAIFQLCKKLASDHGTTQVAAHGPWDNYQAAHYAARAFHKAFDDEAQAMAYGAHSRS